MPVFAEFCQNRHRFRSGLHHTNNLYNLCQCFRTLLDLHACALEGNPRHQSTVHFQYAVSNFQTVSRRKIKEKGRLLQLLFVLVVVILLVLQIFFHGTNRESLCEKIPANCLPKYLGGSLDLPEYPGSLLAEMLSYYEKEYERELTILRYIIRFGSSARLS